ncbi:hypothetical protein PF005_g15355 [Phytophthora fragariae]|uniref:RxLR effector protein n=1 Tax=Phytophthora fragariae TaxID=53985 RepID=A0A6A3YEZ5_9STRA|nr:hypothetical protein PF011_g29540 [Phytophthora fragariae]KAE9066626.1 hypothetical protein PF006_g30179 [Phytophthora fragariae]KAE9099854.1 hypothetical protein PF007_g15724 [Phytophthora fragariae]KAE9200409.1 hypothetical protein PF005_g15355 [Phytophthora fragariae]KAE9213298.1 hypothetical protein PF004_g15387 [Phytophthora fragariae]
MKSYRILCAALAAVALVRAQEQTPSKVKYIDFSSLKQHSKSPAAQLDATNTTKRSKPTETPMPAAQLDPVDTETPMPAAQLDPVDTETPMPADQLDPTNATVRPADPSATKAPTPAPTPEPTPAPTVVNNTGHERLWSRRLIT